jgi:hypothetical protein
MKLNEKLVENGTHYFYQFWMGNCGIILKTKSTRKINVL